MASKNYTTLNIRPGTAGKIRRLKIAIGYSTGHMPGYSEIIEDLIEGMRKYNPALHAVYSKLGQTGEPDAQ